MKQIVSTVMWIISKVMIVNKLVLLIGNKNKKLDPIKIYKTCSLVVFFCQISYVLILPFKLR